MYKLNISIAMKYYGFNGLMINFMVLIFLGLIIYFKIKMNMNSIEDFLYKCISTLNNCIILNTKFFYLSLINIIINYCIVQDCAIMFDIRKNHLEKF